MNWEENSGNEITLSYKDEKSPEGSLVLTLRMTVTLFKTLRCPGFIEHLY